MQRSIDHLRWRAASASPHGQADFRNYWPAASSWLDGGGAPLAQRGSLTRRARAKELRLAQENLDECIAALVEHGYPEAKDEALSWHTLYLIALKTYVASPHHDGHFR